MSDREEITHTFKKLYSFAPVLNFQRKKFKDQRRGWYLHLGWSDKEKIYLGPDAYRALGKLTRLEPLTIELAELYVQAVAKKQADQWVGTKRENWT